MDSWPQMLYSLDGVNDADWGALLALLRLDMDLSPTLSPSESPYPLSDVGFHVSICTCKCMCVHVHMCAPGYGSQRLTSDVLSNRSSHCFLRLGLLLNL